MYCIVRDDKSCSYQGLVEVCHCSRCMSGYQGIRVSYLTWGIVSHRLLCCCEVYMSVNTGCLLTCKNTCLPLLHSTVNLFNNRHIGPTLPVLCGEVVHSIDLKELLALWESPFWCLRKCPLQGGSSYLVHIGPTSSADCRLNVDSVLIIHWTKIQF